MKRIQTTRIAERRHIVAMLAVLSLWSMSLSIWAATRFRLFKAFAEDMVQGNTLPDTTNLLFQTIGFWWLIPVVATVLLGFVIWVTASNSSFRILTAVLIILLVLSCLGATILATDGVVACIDQVDKQLQQEWKNRPHTFTGPRDTTPIPSSTVP
jgi:hypothetical protein